MFLVDNQSVFLVVMISLSWSCGSVADAPLQVLDRMRQARVLPDKFTCSILAKGLQQSNRRDIIQRAMRQVEVTLGTSPDYQRQPQHQTASTAHDNFSALHHQYPSGQFHPSYYS